MNHLESLIYYREYRKNNIEKFRGYAKDQRTKHREERRISSNLQKIRDNDESLSTATNYYQRWTSDEIEYLKGNATKKTVREMCVDLGRTYGAIISKAFDLHIRLMTEDKLHGRLVTKLVRR